MTRRFFMPPLLLLLSGCAHAPAHKPNHAAMTLSEAHFQVRLTITPQPIKQLDLLTFTVSLRDERGIPVPQATVTIALTMPTMDMGDLRVMTHPTSPGTYVGTGRFVMDGAWQATVTATEGSRQTTKSFPVAVQ